MAVKQPLKPAIGAGYFAMLAGVTPQRCYPCPREASFQQFGAHSNSTLLKPSSGRLAVLPIHSSGQTYNAAGILGVTMALEASSQTCLQSPEVIRSAIKVSRVD